MAPVPHLTGVPSLAALHGSDRGGERPPPPAEKPLPTALVVERITHQDVPEICSLYRRVWESPPATGLPTDLVKSWQPTPLEFTSWMEGVTYFAARRDGRLVGVIGCEVERGNCHLVSLAVDPMARRQGIGSALVSAGVEWARHANATEVWADGLARLTAVSALLKHLGFNECGVLHKHEWSEDVRLFERIL
ncbi:MAG: GNAT family N-acetyltransferase [Thermoplasmata archaeon]